jgi:rhomboid protease GluP
MKNNNNLFMVDNSSYTALLPYDGLDKKQAFAAALAAIKALGWHTLHLNKNEITTAIDNGLLASSGKFGIRFDEDEATLGCSFGGLMSQQNSKREVAHFLELLNNISTTNTPEILDQIYNEFNAKHGIEHGAVLEGKAPALRDKLKNAFSLFVPRKGYYITPIIIMLNVLIFGIMLLFGVDIMSPTVAQLIPWGACERSLVLNGEWWRLLSATFLHSGILHLAFNMYALYYIGALIEPLLGKSRFLAAYLLTGITASLLSIWWHVNTTSVGASGAIFGMYGLFLALLTTKLIEKETRAQLLQSIAIFVFLNLALGLKSGIDGAGHLGGLIGGVIIGYAYYFTFKKNDNKKFKYSVIAIATVATILLAIFCIKNIPDTMAKIDAEMKKFSDREQASNVVYEMNDAMPRDTQIAIIKTKGIQLWKENLDGLKKLQQEKLPEGLEQHMPKLIKYAQARLTFNELILASIQQPSLALTDSIRKTDSTISQLLEELK